MSRDIAHAQWRSSIVSMSTWCLGRNISETVRDRDTWPMTSRDPKRSRSWPHDAHYLENGWRERLGDNGAPIGNGYLGSNEWSRDRWRHVTYKGQVSDPNMLRAQYIRNGWRYRLGDNGLSNGHLGIEWSRDRWRHVTLKGQAHDPNMFGAHYLKNGWR